MNQTKVMLWDKYTQAKIENQLEVFLIKINHLIRPVV